MIIYINIRIILANIFNLIISVSDFDCRKSQCNKSRQKTQFFNICCNYLFTSRWSISSCHFGTLQFFFNSSHNFQFAIHSCKDLALDSKQNVSKWKLITWWQLLLDDFQNECWFKVLKILFLYKNIWYSIDISFQTIKISEYLFLSWINRKIKRWNLMN